MYAGTANTPSFGVEAVSLVAEKENRGPVDLVLAPESRRAMGGYVDSMLELLYSS